MSLQRDLLSQWEKGLNEFMVQYMSKGEFGKQLSQLQGATSTLSKPMEKLQAHFLATKGDVARVEARLKSLEDLLGRALALLEQAAPEVIPAPPAPAVSRTKRYQRAKREKP
jgi:hypothetical protein